MLHHHSPGWRTTEIPGVIIHLQPGSAAEHAARAIAESVTVARREVVGLLEGSGLDDDAPRARLFFLNSREEMQRMTGRPLMGFVQDGEPTGAFVYAPGYRLGPLLRHELTHLYSFALWGSPPSGAWLVEGLGAWATGPCQGYTNDELAAGALARGELVPLKTLATAFRETREDIAMPEAGSIVGYLIRQRGLADIRARWTRETPPGEHPLGPEGETIERTWLDELARVRPATLDIPRVMKEGC